MVRDRNFQDKPCSLCDGAGLQKRPWWSRKMRICPACDGKGSIARMLREPPKFSPAAQILRTIETIPRHPIHIMDDKTFRVYFPTDNLEDSTRAHFAAGKVRDKKDKEILTSAVYLITCSSVKLFHEDGTPHR